MARRERETSERVHAALARNRRRVPLRAFRIMRPLNALTTAVAVIVGAYLAWAPLGHPAVGAAHVPAWLGAFGRLRDAIPTFAGLAFAPDFFGLTLLPLSDAAAFPWLRLAAAALCASAFAAAGNVRNDIMDIDIDRVAHPRRPLVSGQMSLPQARLLAVALYALAIAAAALVSGTALLLVLVALPLMEAYERRLKARGLAGNLTVGALGAAPFVLGGLVIGRVGPALIALALLAGLATVGREVLKDIEDARADEGQRRTLPHQLGHRGASLTAGVFLGAAVLLSPLPWLLETVLGAAYLPAVAAADACFLGAAAMGTSRPDRAQRLVKAGMLLALFALVVGRWQGGVDS